jgi:hypothetical protein
VFKTNYYFKVTQPVKVFQQIGCTDSNTFVGSSKMLANVWKPLTLEPGDHILDLCGGLYALKKSDDKAVVITVKISEKHPFEKTYGGCYVFHERRVVQDWKLVEVERSDLPAHTIFRPEGVLPKPTCFQRVGRNIDLLVSE